MPPFSTLYHENSKQSTIISSFISSSTMVKWLSLPHIFAHQSLNSGSAQVHILLLMCWRFAMVKISENKAFLSKPYHRNNSSEI